jgi:hypothetical protein
VVGVEHSPETHLTNYLPLNPSLNLHRNTYKICAKFGRPSIKNKWSVGWFSMGDEDRCKHKLTRRFQEPEEANEV